MGAREAMHCLAAGLVLAASAVRAQAISRSTIATVGGANALSTPAARHLVRMDSGTYLLALQRDGAPKANASPAGHVRLDRDLGVGPA